MVAMIHGELSAFGALLRRYRLAAGLSQEELAERSQLSTSAIGALERGARRAPYRDTVARLAAVLELSPEEWALFERAASAHTRRRRGATAATSADNLGAGGAYAARLPQVRVNALPVLVGRVREWAWLRHELVAGSPLVLLSGEPGIGKSRLLQEARGWAGQHRWRTLWGGCQRNSGQEPYAPLVEALERHLHALPAERRRASLEGCEWLARLLPDVPELADSDQRLAAAAGLPSDQEQRRLFTAVERYLSNVAGDARTLLVLDDLQWVGADALQLLTRLIRSSRTGRLQILGAYRSTEVPPGHPLSTLMADLAREGLVSHRQLDPLEARDAAALARAILEGEGIAPATLVGSEAAGSVPMSHVVERVVERGGGVPFFVVSFARWWQTLGEVNDQRASGWWTGSADDASIGDARAPWTAETSRTDLQRMEEVPWTVRQSIRERVAALPPSVQALLGVAAVVGQRASLALLAAGAQQSELETLEALEIACQAGILMEDPEGDEQERYRFAHDVIRDVVEASLIAGRQTLLHRLVAVALELQVQGRGPGQGQPGAGHLNDRMLSQLAFHYARADMPERAALYLRQAGDHARHVFAHREAARNYHELVICLERLGPSRDAARARRDLAVELARVGRFREALESLEQAEQICHAIGDVETLALVTMVSGHLHSALGASEEGLKRVQPVVEKFGAGADDWGDAAEGRSKAQSAIVIAQLQGALSSLYFMADHYHDALEAGERAVEAAQAAGDTGVLAQEQLVFGVALFTVGRLNEAAEQLKQAIAGAEAVDDLETLAEALRMASWVYQTQGAFADSQTVQKRGLAVATLLGDVVGLGHTLFFDALLAFYVGEWDRARAIAENSLAVFRAVGASHLSAYPPLGLGWLSTIQGDRDTGEQYLAEAEALVRQHGPDQVLRFNSALRAECELLAAKPKAARERLLPWFAGDPMQERTRLELSVLRAWAAVELGLEAEADALVTEAVQGARTCKMHLILPDALRIQALWAMRRQRWDEAERVLDEAIALSRAISYPYAEAKALYVCGHMWMTRGEPALACERFDEALAICRRLGERLYGEAIERRYAVAQAALDPSTMHAARVGVDKDHSRTTTAERE